MTEFEFEDLLSLAMKDESEVPFKTNDKLKKKIKAKLRYKRMMKTVPTSAAACLVIGVILTSVMHNNQEIYEPKVDEINQGVVIETVEENKAAETKKIVEEKNVKQTKTKKAVAVHNYSADIAQIEAYSGAETPEIADEDVLKRSTLTFETVTLIDYLENSQELIDNVSEKVKEKMSTDESIVYFEEFTTITGNENYYLTDDNELVIIFEPGIVAAEENGEIYINVGIIK